MIFNTIYIVGSGNLAHFWLKKLTTNCKLPIGIIARNETLSKALASEFQCKISKSEDVTSKDLVLICVSDSAIEDVSKTFKKGLICLCSGTTDLLSLKQHQSFGVIYPLQTFSKNGPSIIDFNVLIEGNNSNTEQELMSFCELLKLKYELVNTENRQKYHLSAVLVNNFTNAIFVLAQDYCLNHHLNFELLKPLIFQTVENIKTQAPEHNQTGPAKRNDLKTINKHKELIQNEQDLKQVYDVLNQVIQNRFKNSKKD